MAEGDLIQTGIAGLDDILRGGIPKGNVILVEGAAGTGKTLLGMEFIYRGITQYNEPGIIVSFEVAPQKLIRDAASFGWDLAALQQQNQLKLIFTSPQVLSQELRSPDSLLLETAAADGRAAHLHRRHLAPADGASTLHNGATATGTRATTASSCSSCWKGCSART